MSPRGLDPAVLELAAELGWRVSGEPGRVVLQDAETTLVARADGAGEHVLESCSRGSDPVVDVRSSSWTAVELVLCHVLGQAWRETRRLPWLDTARRGRPGPGVTVVDGRGSYRTVQWEGGQRDGGQRDGGQRDGGQWATGLRRAAATTLAHAVGHPVRHVADSYRDPEGRPVFASRPPRPRGHPELPDERP